MKKKKKILSLASLALAACMLLTSCSGGNTASKASESAAESGAAVSSKAEEKASGQLIIGSSTDVEANMMSGWTNGTMNAGIRNLIFGYSAVTYTQDGQFEFDKTVVKSHKETENADGTKTFTVTINDGLTYNDGTPITAKDYVFAALLTSSPEFGALEADTTGGTSYVGYEDFNAGKTKVFSGVRLVDDMTYSLTVKKEELPFYYDIMYASLNPYPMSVLAPGCDIKDDGKGATITGTFTKDVLTKTIGDSKTGYRYLPKVTCGAYQLDSYDPSTKQAVLSVNPKFAGTYDGVKPQIAKLILKSVTAETEIDELSAGTVDLLPMIAGGTSINAGLDVVDAKKAQDVSYMRAGYGKIEFSCDFGPTQFVAVRQAIAYLLDRDEFARQYSGGYAKVVNSFYGLSQWEYKENKDALEKELTHYTLDVDKAKQLLVSDGWTLNKDGKDFKEGTDDVRYKKVDGKLMPLVIEWANTPKNPVSELLSTMLPKEMAKVGMKLNTTTMDFNVLLNNIYRDGIDKPKYHMYNLGAGFVPGESFWYEWSSDPKYFGLQNTNRIADKELEKYAYACKSTKSGDKKTWSENWLKFEKRWNELLPDIPLYSDEYHDFSNPKLQNYKPDGMWDWSYAIPYASVSK